MLPVQDLPISFVMDAGQTVRFVKSDATKVPPGASKEM
jgi:hypothetical protein